MNTLQRLTEIRELPTLPEIIIRIQRLVGSEEGNAQQLADLIEQDPALTARVLKIANSSVYGSARSRFTSLQFAVARIGFNEVSQIVMGISLVKKFYTSSNVLNHKRFWRHSLAAAYLARLVAKNSTIKFSISDHFALFLSGLLHDIGILTYDQFFHEEFEDIVGQALKDEVSYLVAEERLAPRENHAAVGSALLEIWHLDPAIVSAVRFHHAPDKAPEQHQVHAAAVHLTEYILCNSALGSFEGQIDQGNKQVLNRLGIDTDALPGFLEGVELEMSKSDLVCAFDSGSSNLLAIV